VIKTAIITRDGWLPFWKSKNRYLLAMVWPISTNFGHMTHTGPPNPTGR